MASESIVSTGKRCFYCGSEVGLHRHHCIHGTSGRALAEKHGLWIYLCPYHHEFVHSKDGVAHDLTLKQMAEKAWLKKHPDMDIEDWIAIFGKNWL